MKNSVFFPQDLLHLLVDVGSVDLEGDELVLSGGDYRYTVQEAVRITREVTTGEDPIGLCGKVTLRTQLDAEHGAELLGNSMLIEDSAYDVVPGLLGTPTGDVDPSVEAGGNEKDLLKELISIVED